MVSQVAHLRVSNASSLFMGFTFHVDYGVLAQLKEASSDNSY